MSSYDIRMALGGPGLLTFDAINNMVNTLPSVISWAKTSIVSRTVGAASKEASVGFHATTPEAAESILQNGFRLGTKPGRLGSGGVYVNNTVEGAMAEFAQHNPGISPSVLRVEYQTGVNAMAVTPPATYVMQYPLNVGSITTESVRLPGTFNTNILNYNEPKKSDRFLWRNKVDQAFLRKTKKEGTVPL